MLPVLAAASNTNDNEKFEISIDNQLKLKDGYGDLTQTKYFVEIPRRL